MREELLEYPRGLTRGQHGSLAVLGHADWANPCQALMVQSVGRVVACVQAELAAIDAALAAWSKTHPQAVLLQSIPGVGPVISAILVADIGDVFLFSDGRKAVRLRWTSCPMYTCRARPAALVI